MNNQTIQVGQQFNTTTQKDLNKMGINGEGIGQFNRTKAFIQGALPNEKVKAQVTKVYHHFVRAKVVEILKPSEFRVTPKDDYANQVGGFELENMQYDAQLRFKRGVIKQSIDKFKPAGYRYYKIHKTMGMKNPYGYRNKAQFPIRKKDNHVIAGLYQAKSHNLIDLQTCSVQYPTTMKVMRKIVQMIQELNIPVFNETNSSGIIKNVVVRAALNTNDVQVVFITNTPKFIKKGLMLKKIQEELPEVTSVMQNINPGQTSLVWGDKTVHLAGKSYITEKISGLKFQLSARAFLQLNSYMVPQLYEVAINALGLSGGEKLVDAYSGVGTIGLPLAKYAKEVRGMDTIPEAVEDANKNAKINGISNAKYVTGKAEELLPQWVEEGWQPDAIIVDPPRVGLDQNLIKTILKIKPDKLVYVSCNPATMAKNLVPLAKEYNIDYIQPIDMMPQTARCEAVVKFTKK